MTKTIAYIMSRFPTISETFVLFEILELEELGLNIELFPLIHERGPVVHPEAKRLENTAHYRPLLSMKTLSAQFYWLFKAPRRYLRTWLNIIRGNLPSPKFLSRAVATMPMAAAFARQMQVIGIDHIHAHFATHPALAAYIAHQLTDIPYSITAHAHDIYVDRTMLKPKLDDAAFVVTISDFNWNLLRDLYGDAIAEKIRVIRCGVNAKFFQLAETNVDPHVFTIVCVASLRELKGQRYLIEACSILKTHGLDFQCLFIGEGEDRPLLEALIDELGLQDEVKLLGAKSSREVSDFVSSADVFVLPSVVQGSGKMDGIPVALMEALAVGKPAISTYVSGIPELIKNQETGLLVEQKNPQALAEAILSIARDPQLAETLGEAGRAHVLTEFDLKANTAHLFKKFVNGYNSNQKQINE